MFKFENLELLLKEKEKIEKAIEVQEAEVKFQIGLLAQDMDKTISDKRIDGEFKEKENMLEINLDSIPCFNGYITLKKTDTELLIDPCFSINIEENKNIRDFLYATKLSKNIFNYLEKNSESVLDKLSITLNSIKTLRNLENKYNDLKINISINKNKNKLLKLSRIFHFKNKNIEDYIKDFEPKNYHNFKFQYIYIKFLENELVFERVTVYCDYDFVDKRYVSRIQGNIEEDSINNALYFNNSLVDTSLFNSLVDNKYQFSNFLHNVSLNFEDIEKVFKLVLTQNCIENF